MLERHGGTVEKYIGDAVMAVFGIPAVHEDDALRAVRAAAEMRDALASLNKELERDRGVTIASRIGVNTGDVVAGDATARQSLVTGDAVNVAARLEQAAAPGEILIGAPTMSLVRDAVVAEPVEPLTLKGKTGTVAAFRLAEVGRGGLGVARRLDTPMVGRARELDALRDAFARAVRDRSCVLATILGVPGVGKSRLIGSSSRVSRTRPSSSAAGASPTATASRTGRSWRCSPPSPGSSTRTGPPRSARRSRRSSEARTTPRSPRNGSPSSSDWRGRPRHPRRRTGRSASSSRPSPPSDRSSPCSTTSTGRSPDLLDLIEHVAEWTRDAPILLRLPGAPGPAGRPAGLGRASDGHDAPPRPALPGRIQPADRRAPRSCRTRPRPWRRG